MSQLPIIGLNTSKAANSTNLIDALNSEQQRVINGFVTKMPWALVKEAFKYFEIDDVGSNQKVKTAENLVSYLNSEIKVNKSETLDLLKDLRFQLLNNIGFGDKGIYSYKSNSKQMKAVDSALSTLLPKKDFATFIKSESEVTNSKVSKPKLVSRDVGGKVTRFIFSSIKTIEKTTKLDPANHEGLETFSKLYGKEIIKKQYFDSITLDYDANKIRIMIDNSDNESLDFSAFYRQELIKIIKKEAGVDLTSKEDDVFHVVTDVCEQKKLPYSTLRYSVHELNFVSIEGTNYKEKKSPSKPDVRKDAFHSAGEKGANGNISFYRVGINFNKQLVKPDYKYKLILTIPGTFKRCIGGNAAEKIDIFIIKSCMSYDDYVTISKVMV
ncbi:MULTISPECIES: hypothetical protein [unclassified Pantoea]|uniref:hypothetical protein n=1 Tax=unclassified Pantoea TaxID=2630326 RepID=UPI001CD62ECA|nr:MULTISPECIES: hypothetical protein [unclassified Pantoea]MCA1178614.1 hypothetical protein [Pantoea sp. alder69]MCA1252032.1 hypothetical protein [Pantoea sp. alder70]MCA1267103.1 hypothetical protein [Pantoea sp. alder81]